MTSTTRLKSEARVTTTTDPTGAASRLIVAESGVGYRVVDE